MNIGNLARSRVEPFADLFQVTIDYLVGRSSIPQKSLTDDVLTIVGHFELSDEEILSF